jgi:hypothetical protein
MYEFTRQATFLNRTPVLLRQSKKGAQFTVEEQDKKEAEIIWTCDRHGGVKCIQNFVKETRR